MATLPPSHTHLSGAPEGDTGVYVWNQWVFRHEILTEHRIRDGASSVGNFSALSQFYQTHHEKRLVGGYLSWVSKRREAAVRRFPVLDALLVLSEERPLDEAKRQLALERGRRFVEGSSIGYVVIDTARASPDLIRFAIEVFDLEKIDEEGALWLYQPRRSS